MTPTINEPGYELYTPKFSSAEKSASLERRDKFLRRKRTFRQSWKLALANAHVLSKVPVSQIVFYFNCREAEVERWVKATHRRRLFGWTKWRPELDLYEIAGVLEEDFI